MTDITVYQPDFLYSEGRFHEGRALSVSAEGLILEEGSVPAGARVVRLPGRALLPGLVNGHSHAFQRLIRGRTEYVASGREADDFWSWREAMYRAAESLGPEDVYVASRQAFVEMALAGITTVGEFHYLHHQADGTPYADRNTLAHAVIRAARDVGLRICLLRVGYARAGFRVAENPRQRRFIDRDVDAFLASAESLARELRDDPAVSVGLAPHSVRA
ncbi:amidohydrolase family protein, partial [Pyxidicoccus sp. 3LG]